MPKKVPELSDATVRRLTHGIVKGNKKNTRRETGSPCTAYHAVGGVSGLLLQCSPTGARSWILRVKVGDKRRDIGLGGYPDVTLSRARGLARELKESIRNGNDPVMEKRAARRLLLESQAKDITFDEAAEIFLAGKVKEFNNTKHAAQWGNTLSTYAGPIIGNLPVSEIELNHVLQVLQPIWLEKTETAKRLRGRIEAVLSWATAAKHRSGLNPARWKENLEHVLPKPNKVTKVAHHPALPYEQTSSFLRELQGRSGTAARAVEFLILTAARSGEVRGATWAEFDLKQRAWTISGERMKAGEEHSVPLSDEAMGLLKTLPRFEGSEFVFPAPRGGVLSDMTLSAVIKRINKDTENRYIDPKAKRPITIHGFRSTFRDWVAEQTSYPNIVAEKALAHVVGNKVEAAYRRGSLWQKRVLMMQEWATYTQKEQVSADVVSIREAAS